MAFKDTYNFDLLKNDAEQLVLQELEIQLAEQGEDICLCEECVLDMAGMALNAVKPVYRFSLLGSLYAASAMHEPSYADSVHEAVKQAIAKVKANPSHD